MTPPTEENRKRTPTDYIFGKVLGEGSFSTVYLAKDVHTSKEYAIKVLEKTHIIREKKTEYVMREKEVLRLLGNSCPYFVRLYWTFQDASRLYFVLSYAKNGDILTQIDDRKNFGIECARYYAAELLLGIEFLHEKGIIHRDLKPENLLFDEHWHLLITDLGSAKILAPETAPSDTEVGGGDSGDGKPASGNNNKRGPSRRNSFVGTAQFVSPEMLTDTHSSYESDLWAFGCILFQMVCGGMPFRGGSEYLVFQKILKLDYSFPEGFDDQAKELVEALLVLEPEKRLGAQDETRYSTVRRHRFFDGFNWEDLGPPPKMADECDGLPETEIPDYLEPGLDRQKATRLHFDLLCPTPVFPTRKKSLPSRKITDVTPEEIQERLEIQRKENAYHGFVEDNLILKQGFVDKKKGFFPKRRMFLLTLGPHLYYVDPVTQTLKGEIPWSNDLKTEAKNFKIFFVHTPHRKYYLEDPDGYALEWCKAIDEVKNYYFPD